MHNVHIHFLRIIHLVQKLKKRTHRLKPAFFLAHELKTTGLRKLLLQGSRDDIKALFDDNIE